MSKPQKRKSVGSFSEIMQKKSKKYRSSQRLALLRAVSGEPKITPPGESKTPSQPMNLNIDAIVSAVPPPAATQITPVAPDENFAYLLDLEVCIRDITIPCSSYHLALASGRIAVLIASRTVWDRLPKGPSAKRQLRLLPPGNVRVDLLARWVSEYGRVSELKKFGDVIDLVAVGSYMSEQGPSAHYSERLLAEAAKRKKTITSAHYDKFVVAVKTLSPGPLELLSTYYVEDQWDFDTVEMRAGAPVSFYKACALSCIGTQVSPIVYLAKIALYYSSPGVCKKTLVRDLASELGSSQYNSNNAEPRARFVRLLR